MWKGGWILLLLSLQALGGYNEEKFLRRFVNKQAERIRRFGEDLMILFFLKINMGTIIIIIICKNIMNQNMFLSSTLSHFLGSTLNQTFSSNAFWYQLKKYKKEKKTPNTCVTRSWSPGCAQNNRGCTKTPLMSTGQLKELLLPPPFLSPSVCPSVSVPSVACYWSPLTSSLSGVKTTI